MSSSGKKSSKVIKVTNEGIKGNYVEDYETSFINWTPEVFNSLTQLEIISKNKEEIVFDIKNIDPSIINAFRRIIISEVPTLAIESVIINQNTSIIPDEVFAHRLGLIPIFADANDFENYKTGDKFNGKNSMKFELKIKCYKDKNGEMINKEIYSKDLKFIPQEGQEENEKFFDSKEKKYKIGLVHDDILLNKLRPGMEIDLECYAVKGIGRAHAKWSPVCTAYYRLLSDIKIKNEIKGDEAKELKSLCPCGVFVLGKNDILEVGDERKCTTCRECIRHEKYGEKIELGKKSDHYEFHIESVGMYSPESIFFRGIEVMKEKIKFWKKKLEEKTGNK